MGAGLLCGARDALSGRREEDATDTAHKHIFNHINVPTKQMQKQSKQNNIYKVPSQVTSNQQCAHVLEDRQSSHSGVDAVRRKGPGRLTQVMRPLGAGAEHVLFLKYILQCWPPENANTLPGQHVFLAPASCVCLVNMSYSFSPLLHVARGHVQGGIHQDGQTTVNAVRMLFATTSLSQ